MKRFSLWKSPSVFNSMLSKSVFSPLLSSLGLGTLYSLFHFYTVYVYLVKYGVNGKDLALALLASLAFRLIASLCVYFLINCVKQRKLKVHGRRIIYLFGFTACFGFIFLWHPWSNQLIGLQLSLAIAIFEVSMENMMNELSRVFELQLFALKKPIHLILLVEIVFTTGTLAILCVQFTTENTSHLLGLELAFLVVTILAGGCFLFSGLFYPTTAQLTLLKGRQQLVTSVCSMAERFGSVLHAINGQTKQELESRGPLEKQWENQPGLLEELGGLFINPHFYWPCLGKALRQARIVFNVTFLMLFTQLFLVTFGRFSETGFGINLYFLLCLTIHALVTKLLWKILRVSGPIVVNCMLTMLSVALNVLILIFGRNNYFLTMCYIFFENVFSSSCSQITYAMLQTNFLENDAKSHPNSKALSKKKVAFISGLLASTAEYLVLALSLILLFQSSKHLETFVQNPAPFAEKCKSPTTSKLPNFMLLQLISENNSIVTSLNSSSGSNKTFSNNSTLLQMAEQINLKGEERIKGFTDTNEESSESTTNDTPTVVDNVLCENMLDVAFVVAALLSAAMAAAELFVMKLYKRHFVWKVSQ